MPFLRPHIKRPSADNRLYNLFEQKSTSLSISALLERIIPGAAHLAEVILGMAIAIITLFSLLYES